MSKTTADASMDFLLGGGKIPAQQEGDTAAPLKEEASAREAEPASSQPAQTQTPAQPAGGEPRERRAPAGEAVTDETVASKAYTGSKSYASKFSTSGAKDAKSRLPDNAPPESVPRSGTYLGNGLYQRADGPKKKVEVYIEPVLDKRLRMEAAEKDSSKAEVIARLIERHYEQRG